MLWNYLLPGPFITINGDINQAVIGGRDDTWYHRRLADITWECYHSAANATWNEGMRLPTDLNSRWVNLEVHLHVARTHVAMLKDHLLMGRTFLSARGSWRIFLRWTSTRARCSWVESCAQRRSFQRNPTGLWSACMISCVGKTAPEGRFGASCFCFCWKYLGCPVFFSFSRVAVVCPSRGFSHVPSSKHDDLSEITIGIGGSTRWFEWENPGLLGTMSYQPAVLW